MLWPLRSRPVLSGENIGSRDKKISAKILFEPGQLDKGSACRITYSAIDNQAMTATVLRGRLREFFRE